MEFAEECLKVVNPGTFHQFQIIKKKYTHFYFACVYLDCQKEEPTDEQIVEYIREELEN